MNQLTNPCPHPTCNERVALEVFACRRHWFSLPQALRNQIWANYRSNDLDRIVDGYDEAAKFWSGHP